MANPWSDYTDEIISEVDDELGTKYKMSVRRLLAEPTKFMKIDGIGVTVRNMHEDVTNYVDDMLEDMADEQKKFENDVAKAVGITQQLSQNIMMQAKQNKIPFITPAAMERNEAAEEIIYIDNVDSNVLALAESFVKNANLIADFSYNYKDDKIGSWLFDGEKNYMLRVYLPPSQILYLETSKEELENLFKNIEETIR